MSDIVFTLRDTFTLFGFAVAAGGLGVMVRTHEKRLNDLDKTLNTQLEKHEKRIGKMEDRFVEAIEGLGDSMSELTTELKTVLAVHENRLQNLEDRR